ncbi:MAG: hypothetical protein M3273_00360 [Actinomycetota bacterium]|nr:hypothetical protein [Actinomycetota bacterium]
MTGGYDDDALGYGRDDFEDDASGPRSGFALRLIAAFLALALGVSYTLVLINRGGGDETTPLPGATETATPHRADPGSRGPASPRGEPSVYDAVDDLERCLSTDLRFRDPPDEPGLEDDLRVISKRLERVRRLEFARPVESELLPEEALAERARRSYGEPYRPREARRDERVLAALGLIPQGTDLDAVVEEVASGAAGFYDSGAKKLYARTTDGALAAFDEVVLVHELDHALVDQTWGLPGTVAKDPRGDDAAFARAALAEGDATLAMIRYASAALPGDLVDAFRARFTGRVSFVDPAVPYVFERASGFPYWEGLLFACSMWRRGGWADIDGIYGDPPASTAQIVWPRRYLEEVEPLVPPDPKPPREPWKEIASSSLGVADLMFMLENADEIASGAAVPGSHADEVAGWTGGALHAWAQGAATAVHLSVLHRPVPRYGPLCRVLRRWYGTTFPDAVETRPPVGSNAAWSRNGVFAELRCERTFVQLALGPAPGLVHRLVR